MDRSGALHQLTMTMKLQVKYYILQRRHIELAYERNFLCNFQARTERTVRVCFSFLALFPPIRMDHRCEL